MKKKRVIILILQLVIIVAAAVMFLSISNNTVQPVDVYIYQKDILSTDEPIREGDVVVKSIPKAALTNDLATNIEDVIGKYVDGKVRSGQYVYKSSLITFEELDPFSQMDLSKHRKISLPISFEDGFSGNIKKGDSVDLIYTGSERVRKDGGVDSEFKYSKVFLQDILVYSVNSDDGFKFKDFSHQTPGNLTEVDSMDVTELSIITLAVTLEQAEEINTRLSAGNVGFLGRFEGSKSYNTLGYVLGDYEKVHSGKGYAETGNVLIEEDSFDIVD